MNYDVYLFKFTWTASMEEQDLKALRKGILPGVENLGKEMPSIGGCLWLQ